MIPILYNQELQNIKSWNCDINRHSDIKFAFICLNTLYVTYVTYITLAFFASILDIINIKIDTIKYHIFAVGNKINWACLFDDQQQIRLKCKIMAHFIDPPYYNIFESQIFWGY